MLVLLWKGVVQETTYNRPKMRHTNVMNKDEETNQAAREAMKGAFYGTVKWGAAVGVLCGVGYAVSPLFRSFTIQFKTYVELLPALP